METPAQQAAWLGVPYVSSTACGRFRSPIPTPLGSFFSLLPAAPWLIRYLPQARQITVSAGMVEAARILAADGRPRAALRDEQGEAFALAAVNIPAERPQPHTPQPRPPVPRLVYFASDRLLTLASLRTYARRNKGRGNGSR